jgi:hypothetical protein
MVQVAQTAAVQPKAAVVSVKKAKPAESVGKKTKEQKRGLPPSAKTLAQLAAAKATETADEAKLKAAEAAAKK